MQNPKLLCERPRPTCPVEPRRFYNQVLSPTGDKAERETPMLLRTSPQLPRSPEDDTSLHFYSHSSLAAESPHFYSHSSLAPESLPFYSHSSIATESPSLLYFSPASAYPPQTLSPLNFRIHHPSIHTPEPPLLEPSTLTLVTSYRIRSMATNITTGKTHHSFVPDCITSMPLLPFSE